MNKNIMKITALVIVCFFITISESPAMDIVTRYIGGTPPANTSGSGNLTDIVNAAARMWESAYSDRVTLNMDYGWAPINEAGNHIALEFNGQGNQEIACTLLFNNNNETPFFLDPTPYTNEEYQQKTEEFQDFGGGEINVARIYKQPNGIADGYVDLFSVALHEIGHAMGLSVSNHSFSVQGVDGYIIISEDLPFTGTIAPLAYNLNGVVPHFDPIEVAYGCLMVGVNAGERRIPSELDILANAQISGYTILNLSPSIKSPQVQVRFHSNVRSPILRGVLGSEQSLTSKTGSSRTSLSYRGSLLNR